MAKPTSIRLSDEIYNKIKEDSDKYKRSITKQIEYIIEKYYELQNKIKDEWLVPCYRIKISENTDF